MDPLDKTFPDDRGPDPEKKEQDPGRKVLAEDSRDIAGPVDNTSDEEETAGSVDITPDEEEITNSADTPPEEVEEEIFPWRAYEDEGTAIRMEVPTKSPEEEAGKKTDLFSQIKVFFRDKGKWILGAMALLLLVFVLSFLYRSRQVLTQPIRVEESWKRKMLKGETLYYLDGTDLVAREGGRERFRVGLGKKVTDLDYGHMIYALADGKIKVFDMGSGDLVGEKEEEKALWLQPLMDGGLALALPDRILLLDRNLEVREVQEARAIPYAFYHTSMGTARLDGGPIQKDLVVQGQVEWDVGIAPYPPEDRSLSFLAIHEEGRSDILLPSRRPLLDIKEGPKGCWLVLSDDRLLVIREGAMVRSIPFTQVRDWAMGDRLAVLDGAKIRLLDLETWEVKDLPLDFIPRHLASYQGEIYIFGEGKLARLGTDLSEGKLALKKGISQPIIQNLDGSPAAVTDKGLVHVDRVDLTQEEKTPKK